MAVTVKVRSGTAAAWTSANPTLAAGEVGYETDTYMFKIGDGVTAWTSRAYFISAVASHTHSAADITSGTLADARIAATSVTQHAAAILTALLAHDGPSSGLDSDLLDGMQPASTNTASTVVARDSSGNFSAGTITATSLLPGSGSAATPSLAFSTDTDTGIYRIGADSLGIATGGTLRLTLNTAGLTSTLPFLAAAGTAAAPGLSFSADPNTGLYRVAADTLGFATAGVLAAQINSVGDLQALKALGLGGSHTPSNGPILTLGSLIGGGTGYRNGTHTSVALTGGSGARALATVVVSAGVVQSVALTWGGNRYVTGGTLTVPALGAAIATTGASGTGSEATLSFATLPEAPFEIGAQITVAGVTPTEYNGTNLVVTACTTTSVSYTSTATGAQTVAGTVTQGTALTSATIPVATVQPALLYASHTPTSDTIGARVRLEANDTSATAGQEYGAVVFAGLDASTQGSGDLGLIRGLAEGTSGGCSLDFWTAANGAAPTRALHLMGNGDLRLYNSAGTFYHAITRTPTANRTLSLGDGNITLTPGTTVVTDATNQTIAGTKTFSGQVVLSAGATIAGSALVVGKGQLKEGSVLSAATLHLRADRYSFLELGYLANSDGVERTALRAWESQTDIYTVGGVRASFTDAGQSLSGLLAATGTLQGTRLISTQATGTAPLTVSSTTVVANLNSDLFDGYEAAAFPRKAEAATIDAAWTFDSPVTCTDDLVVSGTVSAGSGIAVTGNITVTGTVDGRDVAADGTKLDGIASGATVGLGGANQVLGGTRTVTGAYSLTVDLATADHLAALVVDPTVPKVDLYAEDSEFGSSRVSVRDTGIDLAFDGGADFKLNGTPLGVNEVMIGQGAGIAPKPQHLCPPIRYAWTDFYSPNASQAQDPYFGTAIQSGTQSASPGATYLVAGVAGLCLIRSSANADSGYRWITENIDRIVGQADLYFRAILAIADDMTNKTVRFGFGDMANQNDAVDGTYFELTAGSLVCTPKTSSNSTRTSGSTYTLTAGTFYVFEVYWDSTSSVNFKIKSLDEATTHLNTNITTNIPTGTSRVFGAGLVATSSGTAQDDLLVVDYMGHGFKNRR